MSAPFFFFESITGAFVVELIQRGYYAIDLETPIVNRQNRR
ncbi:hypothetical protein [Xenorhabdus santafensis]|nr:hypothetical protein [Xenorhabdus sp. 12]